MRAGRRPPRRAIFCVKAEHRPHYRCAQIEQNLQEGAYHHEAVEGHTAHSLGPSTHGHYNHHYGQNKAESIDDNTVDGANVAVVLAPVGQSSKDDAGHEALNNFEEARDGGHVAHHSLARPGSAQGHFSPVGQSPQDGADGHSDAEISDIAAGVGALSSDKEERVDHRGCHIPAGEDRKHECSYDVIKPGKNYALECHTGANKGTDWNTFCSALKKIFQKSKLSTSISG